MFVDTISQTAALVDAPGGQAAPGPGIIISGMVEESLGKVITTKPILAGVVHMGLLIVILNRNN